MNIVCTLYVSTKKLGTLIAIPPNTTSIEPIKKDIMSRSSSDVSQVRVISERSIFILTDVGTGPRIDLQLLDTLSVDEPLRKLSSNEYIIITDKHIMIKDKIYQTFSPLSSSCHWKAIPIVKMNDIIDYESTNTADIPFLREGYARELSEAETVLVPQDWDDLSQSCTPLDLLIKKDNTSFSGRKGYTPDLSKKIDRYIYLDEIPSFTGEYTYPTFTYNMENLIYKYQLLQYRLRSYGSMKVESSCVSLQSIMKRLREIDNQYMAGSIYDDVVSILSKIQKMQ